MEYKDRSTGLMIFGVLTIGLGLLCGLLIVFMLSMALFAGSPAATSSPKPSAVLMVPAVVIYGTLAVALIGLGIGTILAKRWARALMLIFSWSWLIVGVMAISMMAFLLPPMLSNLSAQPGSPGAPPLPHLMDGVLVFIFIFYGFIFVLLPGIWTYFFSSRQVRATCEARHPSADWTDACPLPVLAVVLWLGYSVLSMLTMPITGLYALPFFGTFLTGLPADAAFLVLGTAYVVAAWRMYRLDLRGWWILVGVFTLFLISGLVTFARHDIMDMYRAMNLPADQLAQMEKMGIMKNTYVLWLVAAFCVPAFGYMIYLRRYFRPQAIV